MLTERLAELILLSPRDRVLDVASGRGESAIHLARTVGCSVTGVDFGAENVALADTTAREAGLDARVHFHQGDAERLQFPDNSFDVVICECAFCTFPDKPTAANEFARVLRPGGRLGLSDLVRTRALPAELLTLHAWVSCIADAQPLEQYVRQLEQAGFAIDRTEDHRAALVAMVRQIRLRLTGGELLTKVHGIGLDRVDLDEASALARVAAQAVDQGILSYVLLTARLPDPVIP